MRYTGKTSCFSVAYRTDGVGVFARLALRHDGFMQFYPLNFFAAMTSRILSGGERALRAFDWSRLLYVVPLFCTMVLGNSAHASFVMPRAVRFSDSVTSSDYPAVAGNVYSESGFAVGFGELGGAGAGSYQSPTPVDPLSPPSRKFPADFAFVNATIFGSGDRGSMSGASNDNWGGSSGGAGVFVPFPKLDAEPISVWLASRELAFIPSAPPSEIFRPPPSLS